MNNHYETPEALKVGKAQDVILDQKIIDSNPTDNFHVPWTSWSDTIDDFDEQIEGAAPISSPALCLELVGITFVNYLDMATFMGRNGLLISAHPNLDLLISQNSKEGGKVLNNRYEAPEALKLGKAQDVILDQKMNYPTLPIDNLGVPWMSDADSIDDFDEQIEGARQ